MQATIQYIKKELAKLYPESEVQGFIRLLLESICGWSYTKQILNKNERIGKLEFEKIKSVVGRLKFYEPIQYILEETEFMGLVLNVNASVLIPRPETEELVNWIVKENLMNEPRILDIGTGSGCIPLALKNQIKDAKITTVDISADALNVAKSNGVQNNLDLSFLQRDILKWEKYSWEKYNIIVSNPPYVRDMEKAEMEANVLKYEPEEALFVSNEDPLIFYKRIAELAIDKLHFGGQLFFEINESMGNEMIKLLGDKGFEKIELRKDLHNKNRMVCCQKKNLPSKSN